MEKKLKKDLLQVMETVKKFIEEDNISGIKNWSNHIIHSATIFQDKYSIKTSVMVYALASILGDESFREKHGGEFEKFRERVIVDMEKGIMCLKKNNEKDFENHMVDIMRAITKADVKFSEHLGVVLRKARIVKGSWMHHHGITLGRIANLLGITKWELMRKTGGMKEELPERDINRLGMAREFFGVENE